MASGRATLWRFFLAASLLAAAHAGAARDRATGRDFEIPDVAYTRPLADIRPAPCLPSSSRICEGGQPGPFDTLKGGYPMSVAGLGIPLGGIGAGSFMINQSGTFGPWDFGGSQNDKWEIRALPQAAFHIREQFGEAPATVRTLAAPGPQVRGAAGPVPGRSWASPLAGWRPLKPGEATYSALYPFGWMRYHAFRSDVSMRFFSPIVAGEDRRSSLPVAYFDIRIANPTSQAGTFSVMFTMPNVGGHEGRTPATVRTGLSSRAFVDRARGITGVTLGADDPANTPDAHASEWTLAARPRAGQTISFTPSWNASGDGGDVYAPFARDGRLGDAPLDTSHSAGAISVTVRLRPSEVTTIPFVLAWDFPHVAFNKNQIVWMRRYTNFYGARETPQNDYVKGSYPFHQSRAIATDAMVGHDAALKAVEAWWRPIAIEPAYPKVLRTAALNQLSQLAFNNSFWEGGLISSTVKPTLGARSGMSKPGMHLFGTVDSAAGGNTGNSIDVNAYNYLPYNLLFPQLEKDRLRAFAEASSATTDWSDAIVNMVDGPFSAYRTFPKCTPYGLSFIDVPAKLIFRWYAAWKVSQDAEFLRFTYPAMRRALACLQGTIPADRHLPTSLSMAIQTGAAERRPTKFDIAKLTKFSFANTFNAIPTAGIDAYSSQLYLLALEATIDAGRRIGADPHDLGELRAALPLARAEYETTFWDQGNRFYRYTPGPRPEQVTTLLDTFFAQHVAESLGLPDLVDLEHYRTQLSTTYARFMAWRDPEGRPIGAPTLLAGEGVAEWPYVGVVGSMQEEHVITGANFLVAATYVAAGRRFGDLDLRAKGLAMGEAVATQIWGDNANGFAFNAPEMWYRDDPRSYVYPAYERPLAIWALLDAIKPLRRLTAAGR